MIELYTFATPNGRKISVALEELGLPYNVHVVDIRKNEQFDPRFLAINPNNKIPAIVDSEGPGGKPLKVFESGAILIYLADKVGEGRLLAKEGPRRYEALQWLMFQMSAVGPIFGQLNHFVRFSQEKVPYAINRFTQESERILGVLQKALGEQEYLAGEYSIADIATYPWLDSMRSYHPHLLAGTAHVNAYLDRIAARPAVQRGMAVPKIS